MLTRLYLAAVVQEDNICLEHAAASRGRRVVATVGECAAAGCHVGGAAADAPERSVGGVRLLIEAPDETATAAHRLGQRVEHLAAGRHRWEDLGLDSVRRRQGCSDVNSADAMSCQHSGGPEIMYNNRHTPYFLSHNHQVKACKYYFEIFIDSFKK